MKSSIGGWILVALGVVFLARNLGWISLDQLGRYWPVILIVVGLGIVMGRGRR